LTTIQDTLGKLEEMRLGAMAEATREVMRTPPDQRLNFEEKLTLIVDREWLSRDNRRTARRIKEAKLVTKASLQDVACDPERGIAKATLRQLGTCGWVTEHHNIVVVGKTGVGKSYFAAALADVACRSGHRALFTRVPRLLEELHLARVSGTFSSTLGKLSRIDVLVLDDFLLNPMTDQERRDLLEVLEDRYGRSSTVITTQLATKTWHTALGDPTIADAICDRVVHNAHVVALGGPSMRAQKALSKEPPKKS